MILLAYKFMAVWLLAAAAISGLADTTIDQQQRAEAEQAAGSNN